MKMKSQTVKRTFLKSNPSAGLRACRLKAKLLKSGFATLMAAASLGGQAYAQSCTPEPIFQAASSFEGRDASGNPAGFDGNNVEVGDFIVFRDVEVAAYNSAATVDMVFTITDINLASAPGSVAAPTAGVTLGANGILILASSTSSADPYVTYSLRVARGGTVTGDASSGETLRLLDSVLSLQDIDSVTTDQDNSDLGGVANSNTGVTSQSLTSIELLSFQNGGGPVGFTIYSDEQLPGPPPTWDGVTSGDNTDNRLDLEYDSFISGEFLHGFTGSTNGNSTRGAVFAACGTIGAPEITTTKTLGTVTSNPDGSSNVTYTITLENTGLQNLTGLQLTDNLDSVFSSPYDGFIPSTATDSSGGVLALDPTVTIVADAGTPLGTIPTNTGFNGGSDINILDPANTILFEPGDQIEVTFQMRVEPNNTGGAASVTNSVAVSSTDEFGLVLDASNTSGAVNIADSTPSLALDKPAPANADEDGSGSVTFGDTLTYTITATNDGAIDLTNVVVSDPLITPNSESCASVPVGGTCVLTGTYSVTNADVGAGSIDNTASVQSDEITTPITASRSTPTSFTTAPPPPGAPPVEFVDFTNPTDGSVCSGNIPVVAFSGGTNGLSTLDDTFTNGATVNGALTQVFAVEMAADSVNVSGNSSGSITFSSPVTNPLINFYQLDANDLTFTGFTAGQSVALLSSNNGQETSAATNVCNVTLVGNTLSGCEMDPQDQNIGPNSSRSPDAATGPGDLEAAGTLRFTGVFTSINFISSGAIGGDNTTRMAVAVDAAATCAPPNLTLDKPAPVNADEDGSGTVTVGDTLTYTITATNQGTSTLTNVVVTDPLLDAPNSVTCDTLLAGETCVLVGTHTVTPAEANAGMVDNTASVTSDQVTTPVEAMRSTPTNVNPIEAEPETYAPVNGADGPWF